MPGAAILSWEDVRDTPRCAERRQGRHDRFDHGLTQREARMQERTPSVGERTPAVFVLGPAAMGVREAIQALGEQPLGPCADRGPWHADQRRHSRLRVLRGQQQDNLPTSGRSCGERGRPLPPCQGLMLFGR